jgi:outer membrane protein assembly factor BamB
MKSASISLNIMILSGMLIHNSVFGQKPEANIWPNFRGVNSAGIASANQNPPVAFSKDQNVIWKLALPEGHSSPCIWGNNIFLTGFEAEGKNLKMFCIDRQKGNIKWEKEVTVENFEKVNPLSNPATATPTTDGIRVYFYFSSYGLLSYNFKGELTWELKIPVPKSRHGMGTSPIVTGDLVILNCLGHQEDPRILAINKLNGSIVWKYSMPVLNPYSGDSYSTPIVNKDQVIIYASENVSGYDLKTGTRVWTYPIRITDAICTPVLGNEIMYITTYSSYGNTEMRSQFPAFGELIMKYDANSDNKIDKTEVKDFTFLLYPEMSDLPQKVSLTAIFGISDSNKDQMIDSTEWRQTMQFLESFSDKIGIRAIKLGGKGDLGLSSFLWGNIELPPHIPSPLFYNDHVYTIRDGGLLSCFNAKDGKSFYRETLNTNGSYFASPVAAGGKVYLASRNGIVTVIEAGDNLKILAMNNLGELITATPAVVDNKIYLRTDKALYAFGK